MVRIAVCLAALLALASPALGEEIVGRFEVAWGGGHRRLTPAVGKRFGGWLDDAADEFARNPGKWNAKEWGPADVVSRRILLTLESASYAPDVWGEGRVLVELDDAGLPSGRATLQAVGDRVIALLREKVENMPYSE